MKTVFLKLSNYCNSFCEHCYLSIKDRKNSKILDLKKLPVVIKKIDKFFKNDYKIFLHGGELLDLDINYLERTIILLKELGHKNISLQTSFIPLYKNKRKKEDFFDLVKKYDLEVDSSIDFQKIRKLDGKEEIYLNFMENIIKEFNKKTNKKIYSISVTITKKDIGKEEIIYNYLTKLNNYIILTNIGVYISYPYKNKSLYISNKEFSQVLIEFYKLDKKKNWKLFRNLFEDLENNFNNKQKNSNYFRCENCINDYLVIEPNFDVRICIQEPTKIGNVYEDKIIDILTNPSRKEWLKISYSDFDFCNKCEFKKICEVCTVNKNISLKNQTELNQENCPGFYYLLKYINNDLKGKENK